VSSQFPTRLLVFLYLSGLPEHSSPNRQKPFSVIVGGDAFRQVLRSNSRLLLQPPRDGRGQPAGNWWRERTLTPNSGCQSRRPFRFRLTPVYSNSMGDEAPYFPLPFVLARWSDGCTSPPQRRFVSCWREEISAGHEVMGSVEFEEEGFTGLQRFETNPTTLAASLHTALAAGSRPVS